MIADITRHQLGDADLVDGPDLIDDAAVIWAVLNSIHIEDFEGEDVEIIDAVTTWFADALKRHGITKPELFEHIRTAVESGELERFGASPAPGPEPPSGISLPAPHRCTRKYD